ncbi:MAG: S8 family serine peptidase [Bacteroidota bacterium]
MKAYCIILCTVLWGLIFNTAFTQSSYWIFLEDKEGVSFDPYEYFDSKTISRRQIQGLPLDQYTDRPVKSEYISKVEELGFIIKSTSRWLNALKVDVAHDRLGELDELPFVDSIVKVRKSLSYSHSIADTLSSSDESLLKKQLNRFDADSFQQNDIDGKGIRIAVLDAGFVHADQSDYFSHLFRDGRIKGTYDFVKDTENVFHHSSHGTMVLSCLAGKNDEKQLGLATGAEYLLARTEHARFEPYSEEENWLEAIEWADKNGADIVSSSLGFTRKRYFKEDMDGRTSFISKAARIAIAKGMLVVVSMGNEGSGKWKVLSTPADVDSVISVGGIDPNTGIHTSFSSFGPNANMVLKPTLTAFGHVVSESRFGLATTQGTSFAAPLVAGFAACVWQLNPEWSNMKLFDELCKSGDLFPYFDYAHGYGVPQASYFFPEKEEKAKNFFYLQMKKDHVRVEIKKESSSAFSYHPYLFYHIVNEKDQLKEYAVIDPEEKETFKIDIKPKYSGKLLRVFYAGELREMTIP